MTERLRLCVIRHEPGLPPHRPLCDALEGAFDVTIHRVSGPLPQSVNEIADVDSFDAVLWFDVDYDLLREAPGFDWGTYPGARLWLDFDAYQSFRSIANSRHRGTHPATFHKFGFHMLLTTGMLTRDLLIQEGVPSFWLPKGYDARAIYSLDDADRSGLCHYGARYPARRAMLRRVQKAGVPVEHFVCNIQELNERLNRYTGCLICNMDVEGSDVVPVRAWSYVPVALVKERPGIEPMIKNFEVAGAGCAPICDDLPDLRELGFVDGETMVSYLSFSDLVEKLEHYRSSPDELGRIGRNAAEFARSQHTWDHRAAAIESLLRSGVHPPA